MNIFELFILSSSLALDTFGVALAAGALHRKLNFVGILRIAATFGVFHIIMPLIGFFSGKALSVYVASVDHWIAFVLLGFVGGKMIYEAVTPGDAIEEESHKKNILRTQVLIFLAFATSLDAFVTGITFPFMHIALPLAIGCISFAAFSFSVTGALLGKKFGELFGDKIEIFGGVALIILAFKILLTHLFGGA